tara:strand:- start:116 stop:373 length:258 start_codon:yes stop_codon:yes gene_type:complete
MFKEFKEFAMKGSLIDIAVGFVMGAAFKEVVTSFTGGIISPLVGLVFKTDLKNLKYIFIRWQYKCSRCFRRGVCVVVGAVFNSYN